MYDPSPWVAPYLLEISMNHLHSSDAPGPKGFWGSRYSIGLVIFGAVAAYFLLSEHRAHAVQALPYLLLLACPLMHVFMHRGHGGHAGGSHHAGRTGPDEPSGKPMRSDSKERS